MSLADNIDGSRNEYLLSFSLSVPTRVLANGWAVPYLRIDLKLAI